MGTLNIEQGFAPLVPLMHHMWSAGVGKMEKKPLVVNDQIEIRPVVNTVYTFDHRYGDGAVGSKFLRVLKAYIEDPENFKPESIPDNNPRDAGSDQGKKDN